MTLAKKVLTLLQGQMGMAAEPVLQDFNINVKSRSETQEMESKFTQILKYRNF